VGGFGRPVLRMFGQLLHLSSVSAGAFLPRVFRVRMRLVFGFSRCHCCCCCCLVIYSLGAVGGGGGVCVGGSCFGERIVWGVVKEVI